MSDLLSELGARVRALRDLAGMTQSDLGIKVGLERTSIANLERGRQNITVSTLIAIADAVGADVADLLPRTGRSEPLDRAVAENIDLRHRLASVRVALESLVEEIR